MFYRFKCGVFIEAETFDEAKSKFVDKIMAEEERQKGWHNCTCLGFNHRLGCPEQKKIGIPY